MTLIPQRRIPILVVLAILAAGLVLIAIDTWRPGLALLSMAAGVGGLLRVFVPESRIGILAVRSRAFDATFLFFLAALIGVLVLIPLG